jgi:putative PEP-CTERM system histidine kinase
VFEGVVDRWFIGQTGRMTLVTILFVVAGLWPVALAAFALRRPPRGLASWTFAGGMTLLALDALFGRISAGTTEPRIVATTERIRLLLTSLEPLVWLLFSLTYSRGNHREFLRKWRMVWGAAFLFPILAVAAFPHLLNTEPSVWEFGRRPLYPLAWPARVIHTGMLIASVLIIMNLERTLRASVGTLRWRIKFLVLGLGVVFTVRFYTGSQALLFSTPDTALVLFNTTALVLSCALLSVSFLRSSLTGAEVYPSLTVLQHSITVVLAGAYLVLVGLLAKVAVAFKDESTFPLKAFVVMLALVALGIALVSDRLRFQARRFVSRHFQRPLYDYRKLWRSFTERTSSVVDADAYGRELVKFISEALQVLSVSAWILDERFGKLRLSASTSLVESSRLQPGHSFDGAKLGEALAGRAEPFVLDDREEPWFEELKQSNPDQFASGGQRVCVPLFSKGDFLGLLIVGDRVTGVPLSVEDFDLLRSIGDQAAGGLLNLHLAQRLLRAREMEAFQTMAAFFVHDLKNTASSLSLMLQNLPTQMENPDFRQDALRAVTKAVDKLNGLIGRLSLLRESARLNPISSDLDQIVRAAVEALGPSPGIDLQHKPGAAARLLVDPDQIQKVATNLLVNAREAIGKSGEIRIETTTCNGWVILSVGDNGCGMSPEFIERALFRPFQTTKKSGIGIGMFHCKAIVEAHRGRIEVTSVEGKGTTFRVFLPANGGNA